jgi:ATP-dependent Clp protease ATP-binding subunit ClpC
MPNHWSRATFSVVTQAEHEARRAGARQIGTDHLLIGLCDDEAGAAGRILLRAGVTPDAVRGLAAEVRSPEGDPHQHIPYSSLTTMVLEMADREASWRRDGSVAPEHILLAVLMLGAESQTVVLGDLGDGAIKAALEQELLSQDAD